MAKLPDNPDHLSRYDINQLRDWVTSLKKTGIAGYVMVTRNMSKEELIAYICTHHYGK